MCFVAAPQHMLKGLQVYSVFPTSLRLHLLGVQLSYMLAILNQSHRDVTNTYVMSQMCTTMAKNHQHATKNLSDSKYLLARIFINYSQALWLLQQVTYLLLSELTHQLPRQPEPVARKLSMSNSIAQCQWCTLYQDRL